MFYSHPSNFEHFIFVLIFRNQLYANVKDNTANNGKPILVCGVDNDVSPGMERNNRKSVGPFPHE